MDICRICQVKGFVEWAHTFFNRDGLVRRAPRGSNPGNKDHERRTIASDDALITARCRFRAVAQSRNRSDSHFDALISLVTEIEEGVENVSTIGPRYNLAQRRTRAH